MPVWAPDPEFDPEPTSRPPPFRRGRTSRLGRDRRPAAAAGPALVAGRGRDGLPGRQFALVVVVHHIAADGLTGVVLAGSLLDHPGRRLRTAAEPRPADSPPRRADRDLLADRPVRCARRPARAGDQCRRLRALAAAVPRRLLRPARAHLGDLAAPAGRPRRGGWPSSGSRWTSCGRTATRSVHRQRPAARRRHRRPARPARPHGATMSTTAVALFRSRSHRSRRPGQRDSAGRPPGGRPTRCVAWPASPRRPRPRNGGCTRARPDVSDVMHLPVPWRGSASAGCAASVARASACSSPTSPGPAGAAVAGRCPAAGGGPDRAPRPARRARRGRPVLRRRPRRLRAGRRLRGDLRVLADGMTGYFAAFREAAAHGARVQVAGAS